MDFTDPDPGQVIDGADGPPNSDKQASAPRPIAVKAGSAVTLSPETAMKLPKILAGRTNPVATALVEVQRLEGQREKLAERLAAAAGRTGAASAERRRALLDGNPAQADMAKLDRACADAIDAQSGIEEAARHVATQLEDAQRAYTSLVDAAKRSEVATDCETRATAIDTAAERLAEAARSFNEARMDLVKAVATHGVAQMPVASFDGSPLSAEMACAPIVAAAVRVAAPGVLPAADIFGGEHVADVMVATRRAQSGRLRDHVDLVKAGTVLPEAPPVPGERRALRRVAIEEASVILRTGVRYTGQHGAPVLLREGGGHIPRPVAEAAVAAGMGAWPGTAAAADMMRALEATRIKHETGVRPGENMKPGPDPLPTFADLKFDLGAWIAAERTRLNEENA